MATFVKMTIRSSCDSQIDCGRKHQYGPHPGVTSTQIPVIYYLILIG